MDNLIHFNGSGYNGIVRTNVSGESSLVTKLKEIKSKLLQLNERELVKELESANKLFKKERGAKDGTNDAKIEFVKQIYKVFGVPDWSRHFPFKEFNQKNSPVLNLSNYFKSISSDVLHLRDNLDRSVEVGLDHDFDRMKESLQQLSSNKKDKQNIELYAKIMKLIGDRALSESNQKENARKMVLELCKDCQKLYDHYKTNSREFLELLVNGAYSKEELVEAVDKGTVTVDVFIRKLPDIILIEKVLAEESYRIDQAVVESFAMDVVMTMDDVQEDALKNTKQDNCSELNILDIEKIMALNLLAITKYNSLLGKTSVGEKEGQSPEGHETMNKAVKDVMLSAKSSLLDKHASMKRIKKGFEHDADVAALKGKLETLQDISQIREVVKELLTVTIDFHSVVKSKNELGKKRTLRVLNEFADGSDSKLAENAQYVLQQYGLPYQKLRSSHRLTVSDNLPKPRR